MTQNISMFGKTGWKGVRRLSAVVLLAISLRTAVVPAFAQQPGQQTFASAEEAGQGLFCCDGTARRPISHEYSRPGRKGNCLVWRLD